MPLSGRAAPPKKSARPRTAPAKKSAPARPAPLLKRPGGDAPAMLEKALACLTRAFPIPGSHKKDLPHAVRDLSRMLTTERGGVATSYWSAPRYVAAYLHFFLPWNLYRLSWLLPALDLALAPNDRILDLGSGPLTLPLALWCARPDLRSMPLTFICADVAAKPMDHGLKALQELGGDSLCWKVEMLRAPVEKALRCKKGPFKLIMAGNVFNELAGRSPAEQPLARRIEELVTLTQAALAPGGRFFLLEPGTRLGGKLVALVRNAALEQGLAVLAPCTHSGPCPAAPPESSRSDGGREQQRRSEYSGWCHFTHPALELPFALTELSRKAGFEKDHLALSCLLLADGQEGLPGRPRKKRQDDDLDELEALYNEIMNEDGDEPSAPPASAPAPVPVPVPMPAPRNGTEDLVRIISGPIRLPGRQNPARYACGGQGLVLLLDAEDAYSGALEQTLQQERPQRDAKTGALLLQRARPRIRREKQE